MYIVRHPSQGHVLLMYYVRVERSLTGERARHASDQMRGFGHTDYNSQLSILSIEPRYLSPQSHQVKDVRPRIVMADLTSRAHKVTRHVANKKPTYVMLRNRDYLPLPINDRKEMCFSNV